MMIKAALQYIVGLSSAEIKNIEGYTYTDKELELVEQPVLKEPYQVNTLEAIVEYIITNTNDILQQEQGIIIHVKNYQTVEVYGWLNKFKRQNCYLIATAMCPEALSYGTYYNVEDFNIKLQARFANNDDKALLLQLTGNVKDESVRQVGDDGIKQSVTVKTGVTMVEEVLVPNPVTLIPRRTFFEVEQPESPFIFRMKEGPSCALFEADGGAWKQEAMQNIAAYLKESLQKQLSLEKFKLIRILA